MVGVKNVQWRENLFLGGEKIVGEGNFQGVPPLYEILPLFENG